MGYIIVYGQHIAGNDTSNVFLGQQCVYTIGTIHLSSGFGLFWSNLTLTLALTHDRDL